MTQTQTLLQDRSSATELVLLLAEDNDGHAALITRRLRRMGVGLNVKRFTDGAAVLAFLFGDGPSIAPVWEPSGRYALLLDINLPKVDGLEVLRAIRAEQAMKDLKVIMLTTTDDASDVERCWALGCDQYVVKPIGAKRFAEAVSAIGKSLSVDS